MSSLTPEMSHFRNCISPLTSCVRNAIQFMVSLFLAIALTGCQAHRSSVPAANYYYLAPDKDVSAVVRVALVELGNDSSYPQIAAEVTEALYQAMQKKQVFGLTVVRRNNPAWRSLQLETNSTYTLEQLVTIRRTLKCDGILLGTITHFRPYPHMAIGLRLKLLDLKDGQLLWALEQIWDTADKTTEQRIKSYFQRQMRSDFEPLREKLVAISSLRFMQFVAYEVAQTL